MLDFINKTKALMRKYLSEYHTITWSQGYELSARLYCLGIKYRYTYSENLYFTSPKLMSLVEDMSNIDMDRLQLIHKKIKTYRDGFHFNWANDVCEKLDMELDIIFEQNEKKIWE